MRAIVSAALLMALALTGCNDPKGSSDNEVFDDLDLQVTATTGLVRGVILDDAIRPLANATVTLRHPDQRPDSSAVTGESGAFAFDELAPGTYFLRVTKLGYLPTQSSNDVVAGVAEPPIVKIQLAPDLSFVRPYYEQFVFEGFIECSTGAEHPQVGYGYLNACSASEEVFPNDKTLVRYPMSGYPMWVQAEMSWESTQAASTWLSHSFFYSDPGEQDGNKDLSVDGPSPLLNTMDNATAKEYIEGLDFEEGGNLTLGMRMFTVATDNTGAALTIQQRYSVYTTVFYGYLPPPGWLLADGGGVPPPPT